MAKTDFDFPLRYDLVGAYWVGQRVLGFMGGVSDDTNLCRGYGFSAALAYDFRAFEIAFRVSIE